MNRKLLKKAITELQIENDPKTAILDIFLTTEHLQDQIVDIQALVNRIFTEKPTEVKGEKGDPGKDGRDGIDGKDGLSVYPDQVIEALRKLKGKKRLAIANIDGLDEELEYIKLMTGGPSPVYTVTAWTVNPSANAKFVIENNSDILLWSSASTSTFSYAAYLITGGQTADTWSTAAYAVRPAAMAAGCSSFQGFGLSLDQDPLRQMRHSFIYSFRGGAVATLDLFDIAAAATGTWTGAVVYGSGPTFTTGSSLVYDPTTNQGKFAYLSMNGGQHFYRFNCATRQLNEWAQLRYAQGTAVVGNKMAYLPFIDSNGTDKLGFLYTMRNTGSELFNMLLER